MSSKTQNSKNTITVRNQNGDPIENSTIYYSSNNGTFLKGITNNLGQWEMKIPTRRLYTVLVAHPDFPSALYPDLDPSNDLDLELYESKGIGSIVIESTGYIPGFEGRLNPILDSGNRRYLYAENIAINGGLIQPVHFEINKPFELEDAKGDIIQINIKYMKGLVTLIDYTKIE